VNKPTTNYQLPTTRSGQPLRVALVHDWLYGGGAEKVVLELHKMFPDAPIYTSYCTDEWRHNLDNKVITGYLQNWPFSSLRKFLPLLRQRWFRTLDLSEFDIVISSSGNGEAKFVSVKEPAVHICYCHTPTHFYWRHYEQYLRNPGFRPYWLVRLALKVLVKPLRKRDYRAAQKVGYFSPTPRTFNLTSSNTTAAIRWLCIRRSTLPDLPNYQLPKTNYQKPDRVLSLLAAKHPISALISSSKPATSSSCR
jgi:hypothetical protein